ncbi:MAG: hypothetical protein ACC700_20905 [Anaerolineales bacterium]
MFKRSKRHPLSDWDWWQVLALSLVVFGVWGALFGFLPPVSIATIRLGLLFSVPVIIAAMWSWWTYNWWARLATPGLWTILILAIAARAWMLVMGVTWIWLVPILSAYLLAWAMPALNPRASAILWREQMTPQTRVGRVIMGLTLAIGPSAGVIGASVGIFGSRFSETESVILVMAVLASAVAIGFAFAISFQFWPERPWAKNTITEK